MKRIILLCLFLAFMLLISGCRKKPTAAITRKKLTETTILLQAAKVGNIERIKSLISSSVDVNVKDVYGVHLCTMQPNIIIKMWWNCS